MNQKIIIQELSKEPYFYLGKIYKNNVLKGFTNLYSKNKIKNKILYLKFKEFYGNSYYDDNDNIYLVEKKMVNDDNNIVILPNPIQGIKNYHNFNNLLKLFEYKKFEIKQNLDKINDTDKVIKK